MVRPKDEVGNIYGRLTVEKEIGRKRGAVLFLCHCDCNNKTEVTGCDLRSGKVNSCGCFKSEYVTAKNTTHGLKNHRIYSIHRNMMTRCYYKVATHYESYGGRGIAVCDDWSNKENGFINFYNWAMENGYSDDLSIDRIDVNGNYEPSNCKWATTIEQSLNKRNTHYIEIEGKVKTLIEWCEEFGIKYKTVLYRINKGWDKSLAVTTPPNNKKYINTR
jgi:hypothetical protein